MIRPPAGFLCSRSDNTGFWFLGKYGASFVILRKSSSVVNRPSAFSSLKLSRAKMSADVKDAGPGTSVVPRLPAAARYSKSLISINPVPRCGTDLPTCCLHEFVPGRRRSSYVSQSTVIS